jgi:hypothetical protein
MRRCRTVQVDIRHALLAYFYTNIRTLSFSLRALCVSVLYFSTRGSKTLVDYLWSCRGKEKRYNSERASLSVPLWTGGREEKNFFFTSTTTLMWFRQQANRISHFFRHIEMDFDLSIYLFYLIFYPSFLQPKDDCVCIVPTTSSVRKRFILNSKKKKEKSHLRVME